jgi:hypothetical protein
MNINQYQSCLNSIIELKELDFDQIIIEAHPDINNFQNIIFSKYSAAEFMTLFNRMLTQLDFQLTKGMGLLLPNSENYQNDYGSVDLSGELPLFKRYFSRKNFQYLEPLLDKFIHYQVKNGFWNPVVTETKIEKSTLKTQFELIERNQKALEKNLASFDQLKSKFTSITTEVEGLIQTKTAELNQIAQNLQSSTNQSTEITRLLSDVTNKDTEAGGIIHNLKDKVNQIQTDILNYKESYEIIESNWEALEKELNSKLFEATSNFIKAKEHIEFVESRRQNIENLTGMAADGALGSKFNQRVGIILKGRRFWTWAVPFTTAVSILWVLAVFNWYPSKLNNEWINLGVNILKTIPSFILLGFVFKQYSKERNLEEEYAFKSSIAMTLTAYSNMLSERDVDTNESRQEMLLRTIEQLYKQPKIHTEKGRTNFSFSTKDLKESLDNLKESIENLKGKN